MKALRFISGLVFLSFFVFIGKVNAQCTCSSARLCVAIDDTAWVYINGEYIGQFLYVNHDESGEPKCVNISCSMVQDGGIIAIKVSNGNGYEIWGSWALDITCTNGQHAYTVSSTSASMYHYNGPDYNFLPDDDWYMPDYSKGSGWGSGTVVTGETWGKRIEDPSTGNTLRVIGYSSGSSTEFEDGQMLFWIQTINLSPQDPPPPPDVTVTKTASKTKDIKGNEEIYFTITVRNNGGGTHQEVRVVDTWSTSDRWAMQGPWGGEWHDDLQTYIEYNSDNQEEDAWILFQDGMPMNSSYSHEFKIQNWDGVTYCENWSNTVRVTFEGGSDSYTLPLENYCPPPSSVGDLVWEDTNMDGVQDAGESGISGVTVELYLEGSKIATTTTDGSGHYKFTDLNPGTRYQLIFRLPDGYHYSPKDAGSDSQDSDGNTGDGRTDEFALEGEDDMTWDQGMYTEPASIGDYVWEDTDQDGVQEGGENGISGVTVRLYTSSGSQVASTTTDGNGNYRFENVAPGDYYLEFTLPSGYEFTTQNSGSDTQDSDANPSNGRTDVTTLQGNEDDMTWDAGMTRPPASIGDYVWEDTDQDGMQDGGESGISNVTVRLYTSSGSQVASTTTDGSGKYLFEDVAPGDYYLEFTLPLGYEFSLQDATGDTQDSDAGTSNGRTSTTTLEPGEEDMTWDAGMYSPQPASIGDYVWDDTDQDGVQDAGESGLSGVTVSLYTSSGSQVASTTTDGSGSYSFTDIDAGDYYLEFTLPSGYEFSPQDAGGGDTQDSDAGTNNGRTSTTTLEPGEEDMTWDAGMYSPQPASIGDYVWDDTDQDGVQDAGESGLSGVTVRLYTSSGSQVASTTTDGSGAYSFTDIDAGDYYLEFTLPSGYEFSPQDAGGGDTQDSDAGTSNGRTSTTTLEPGEEDMTCDAGMYMPEPASIGDYVWDDTNQDGVQDAGESGLSGVTVRLYTSSGSQVASTTTDGSGAYSFTDISAGDYYLEFTLPSGYEFSPQDAGGGDTQDSDAGTSNGRTSTISLDPGEEDLTCDAGMYLPLASIGDYVWNDEDQDGVQDAGESGISAVTVTLYLSSGSQVATTTTDLSGAYIFEDLEPDDYYLEFTLPSGYEFSPQDAGGGDTQDSDAGTSNGRTSTITLDAGEEDMTCDAGMYSPRASIGDYVWEDADQDGVQDAGESGISGVTVTLYLSSGSQVATTATGVSGAYSFTDLDEGDYYLEFTLPSGYNFSPQDATGDDNSDSDADESNGRTSTTTLDLGENDMSCDAGMYLPPASIGDYVWEDADKDGVQDAGESGLSGVTVRLYLSSGSQVASTTTDFSGAYSFTDLNPDDYYLEFTLPTDYYFSIQDAGGDTQDSDANTSNGRTSTTTLDPSEDDMTWDAGMIPLEQATIDANPGDTTFLTQTLDITLLTNADRIYFTMATDGAVPADPDTNNASQLYTGPITIDDTTTIKAIAVGDGFIPSEIGQWTYFEDFTIHITPQATVNANPGTSSYSTLTLDITLSTNADKIYYTTNGSNPDTNNASQLYSGGPITISGDVIITAIAIGDTFLPSDIESWTYTQEFPTANINANPGSSTYTTVSLDIILTTDADEIYYTTDGSNPDTNNASQLYSGPITISGDAIIKAIAIGVGYEPSGIESWTYTQELPYASINANPGSTTYSTVTLEIELTSESGNSIYYTTDGSRPDTSNPAQLYTGNVTISGDVTLRAIAFGPGYLPTEGSWTYDSELPSATLTANPGDATYTAIYLDVVLTTNADRIYYTSDGSAPDTNDASQLYSNPVYIYGDTVTIRAIAVGVGYVPAQDSWVYIRDWPQATVNANPGSSTYSTVSIDVELTTDAERIYYTTDGTDPDTNSSSQLYSGSVTISGDVTLRAIAVGEGYEPSDIGEWIYDRDLPYATITADPGSSVYETVTLDITLTSEEGNSIYYTTDGSYPDTNNASQLYTGVITISGDVELRAVAFGPGYLLTEESWTYDCELPSPTLIADPEGMAYSTVSLDVTLTTNADKIYYTTDGSEPDTNNSEQLYTGPVNIYGDTVTLRAIAVGEGFVPTRDSWVYIRDWPDASLTADPGSTVYETVTLDVELISEEGNRIYYTTDGTPPDTSDASQLYTGPITVRGDVTINAVAFGEGYMLTEGSWTYDQELPPASLSADPGDGTTFGYTLDIDLSTNAERIYYTTDGSSPDTGNSSQLYSGTITILSGSPDNVTIKAIAVGEAYSPTTGTWTYTREYLPEITALPAGMRFVGSVDVSLFVDNLEAKIYYTLDGTEPDTNSISTILYTGTPIELTETTTLKARAFGPDIIPSPMLTEIYTRIFVVSEALYKDSDGDGRIDMAELKFDELPDSLPTEVVLINPFDNTEKDTVEASGISWLNGDASTLTAIIILNKPFTDDQNTGFETGYFGTVTKGLYMNDAFEIGDGVAPVINSAIYCPGEIIDIETLERAFDTLIVYFSEDVENIDYSQPFIFKTEEGTEYSFNLRQISNVHSMVVFEVIKDEGEELDYPFKEDSLKINYEAGISDLSDNIQVIEENRYADLNVKPKPYKLIVNALCPVDPATYEIPYELIADGIEMTKGLVIVMDFLINLEDDADKLKCNVSIFDPVGNLVVECKRIDNRSGNLQIGIVEGTSTKLVIYWSGQNENGRQVGKGMYIAEINIVDHSDKQIKKRKLVGVKK